MQRCAFILNTKRLTEIIRGEQTLYQSSSSWIRKYMVKASLGSPVLKSCSRSSILSNQPCWPLSSRSSQFRMIVIAHEHNITSMLEDTDIMFFTICRN
ncbi:hypothetical protein P8452_24632 [Trifolium repens]|nr:hypothetical protein P8452_24632 [Trifolium repens]